MFGFAQQNQSIVADSLCFATPILLRCVLALLRKAFSIEIDWLCLVAKPIIFEGMAVFRKAFPCGCLTKPILFNELALLRKSFPTWWIGFASQNQSFVTDWLCIAKPFHRFRGGLALLCNANPLFRLRKNFSTRGLALLHKTNPL